MQSWRNFQAALPPLPQVDVSGLSRNLKNTVQSTKERLGQATEVTELPQEYKALEARVDALYNVHKGLLKIVKVHETESYDYPTNISETAGELGHQAQQGWSNVVSFAHNNLKNTSLPIPLPSAPTPTSSVPAPPKTLAHALSRAALAGAAEINATSKAGGSVGVGGGIGDRLGGGLEKYGVAMEKVGSARLQQDSLIQSTFLAPWQATLSSSLALAMKARANVKTARLELDGARGALKSAAASKQEQARLLVEESEDKLVQTTETAIGLMKAVLENPEPLQNLSSLVKAQLIYFSTAAETLSNIQTEIEDAAVAAETEYRTSRAT